MQILAEARMPHIGFFQMPKEDRQKSLDTGTPQYEDVSMVRITPQGGKDCIEKELNSWLDELKVSVNTGRIPQIWYDTYLARVNAWQKGLEPVASGKDLALWPAVTPAQVKNCKAYGVYTVEALAEASDATISMLGIGAMTLRENAKNYLREAEKEGTLAAENQALKAKIAAMEETLTTLRKRVAASESQIVKK